MTHRQAMLCGLFAFFVFVLYDVAVKFARHAGLTPHMIIAAIGIVGTIGLAATVLPKRGVAALRPQHYWGLAFLCLCSLGTRYCNVTALKYLPLTTFYAVVFSAPLVIAALSLFLKHEKFSAIKTVCLVAGFGGTLVVLTPGLTGEGEKIGYVVALLSVFLFSSYVLLMRILSQTESVATIQFSILLLHAIIGLAGGSLSAPTVALTPMTAALLVAVGTGFTVGSLFLNKALQHTASTNVAQLHYTQIIYGAILGYFIWGDIPTWNLAVGAGLIIAAGIIVAMQAQKNDVLE